MDHIFKIFSGKDRVKLYKFFLNNRDESFVFDEIVDKLQIRRPAARKELKFLEAVTFLKKGKTSKIINIHSRAGVAKQKKVSGTAWQLNKGFEFIRPFSQIFIEGDIQDTREILSIFRGMGTMKLMLATGFFAHDDEARADLLIVGNKLKKTQIENAIHKYESEIGCELRYIIFEEEEFLYRLQMYDRLIRDVLGGPHRIILNKLRADIGVEKP